LFGIGFNAKGRVKDITAKDFKKEVLHAGGIVLVDFFAKWNGTCHLNSQVIDSITCQLAFRIKIFRLDIEKYPGVAKAYGVNKIPAVIIFSNGKVIEHIQGLSTKHILQQKILNLLRNQ